MPIRYHQLSKYTLYSRFPCLVKQQGSSLVLALFIIIILSLLGGVLMKIISTSSETVSQEVLGTRAYMAANSAMQAELALLFPLNTSTGSCNTANVFSYNFKTSVNQDIPGLYSCEATTTCDNYFTDARDPMAEIQYYRLTSTGKCGSGDIADNQGVVKSSRTIQVEARSL